MRSYTAARDADNKRLVNEGQPYRYDCAGYARCKDCGAYWHDKHRCGDGDYYGLSRGD